MMLTMIFHAAITWRVSYGQVATKLQPCFVAVALGHTEQAQAHVCFAEQGRWKDLLTCLSHFIACSVAKPAENCSKAARVDGMLCSNAEMAAYL